jgi:hypothetical protein
LIKVPLIIRILGHFEEVPQKVEVLQKLATFWGTLIEMLQKITILGAL